MTLPDVRVSSRTGFEPLKRRTLLTNVACALSVEFVPEHKRTLRFCAVAWSDVICFDSPLHCSPP
jgi:hypothetical protein